MTTELQLEETHLGSGKSLWSSGLALLRQPCAISVGSGTMMEIPVVVVVHISEYAQS